MTRLADQLARQIRPSPTLHQQLAALKREHGTVTAAAKAVGIGRRTWQYLESGKSRHPRPATLAKIRDAAPQRARPEVEVKWRYDGRTRILGEGPLRLAPGTQNAMQTAIDAGDKEGAARAFLDGIQDDFYHDRMEEAYDEDLRGEEISDIDDYNEGFAA